MNNEEILKKLRASLESTVKKVMKLASNLTEFDTTDGDTIGVDGDLMEGADVYLIDESGNQTPLEDGDYVLTTGQTISVSDGTIDSISGSEDPSDTNSPDVEMADSTATDGATAPTTDTDGDAAADSDLESRVSTLEGLMDQVLQVLQTSMTSNETLLKANEELKEKVEKLSKQPAASAIKTQKSFKDASYSPLEAIRNRAKLMADKKLSLSNFNES